MSKNEMELEKKPFINRLLLFIVGLIDFPIALVIIYVFDSIVRKEDKWKLEMLDRGAKFGLIITILGFILWILSLCFTLGETLANI